MCVCDIYIYIQTDRQTDIERQTDTQRERETFMCFERNTRNVLFNYALNTFYLLLYGV